MPAECCHSAVTGVTSYCGIAMIVQQIRTGNCQLIEKGDEIKPKSPPPPPPPSSPLPSSLADSRLLPPPNITPVSAISPPRRCRSPLATGASKNLQPQPTPTTHQNGRCCQRRICWRCCWGRRWWGKEILRPCEGHST